MRKKMMTKKKDKRKGMPASSAETTKTARAAAVMALLLLLLLLPITAVSAQEQQQQSSEEEEEEEDDDIVTIVSHRTFIEQDFFTEDYLITGIVGEVRNDSPNTIGEVDVRAMFYDSNGQLIDVADGGNAELSVLRPGERAPFFIPSVPTGFANYTLSPEIGSSNAINKPAAFKVAIGDHGVVETESVQGIAYKIVGNVTNVSNRPSTYVTVIATFYDAAGKIIDYKIGRTFPAEIPPGETAEFTFEDPLGGSNWTAETNSVASFNVTAESAEYLSVMESPFASTEEEEEGATAAEGAAGFLTYDNATYGITIQYPSDWTVDTTTFLGLPQIDMLLLITILTFSDNEQKIERRGDRNLIKAVNLIERLRSR
jgi:hypothetical protein